MTAPPADGRVAVRTLFEIPLAAPIEPVVQVASLADERALLHEIGATIVTPLVERHLTALATAFAGTEPASSVGTGVWIDGAYGSGKSHLAKLLGLLCANPPLDGIGAGRRIVDRVSPRGDARSTLERALEALERVETRIVALSLASLAGSSGGSLAEELLARHYQGLGYCENLLYARVVEAELSRQGKLAALHAEAERRARAPWAELRANPAFHGKLLAEAAAVVAPEQFSSARAVERALDLAARGTRLSLEIAVAELGDWLVRRTEQQGRDQRIVCILDEAGAWLGRDPGRLAELGQLLELGQRIAGQPLWIIVVTHANLDEVAGRVGAPAADRRAIEGRFRLRMSLDDENLTQVLEGRVLAKTPEARAALRRLYAERGGAIRDLGELAGVGRVLPACDEAAFVARYPFAPYAAELTAVLVRSLRAGAGHDPELGGSTRTLLALTQQVLRGSEGPAARARHRRAEAGPTDDGAPSAPADRPFGSLVPFDALYRHLVESADVAPEMAREVRLAVRRIEQSWAARLDGDRPPRDLPSDALALATRLPALLALLDALPIVPRTVDNLARLLADRVEDDVATHAARLSPLLDWLETLGVVGRLGGQSELLVGIRRLFEEQVALSASALEQEELVARLAAQTVGPVAELAWSSWLGLRSVELFGTPLPLRLWVDDKLVAPRGELAVRLVTPLRTAGRGDGGSVDIEALERRSVRPEERGSAFLWCAPSPALESDLRRFFARRDVLGRFDPGTEARRAELAAREVIAGTELRERVLERLRASVDGGCVVFRGSRWSLAPRSAGGGRGLSSVLSEVAAAIYPKLRQVPVRIADPAGAIRDVMAGRVPVARDAASLGLWDADGGTVASHPLLDAVRVALSDATSPSASRLVGEARGTGGRRRGRGSAVAGPSDGPLAVRGADLLGRLRAPPYGWDPSVVRLGVAALAREGAVELRRAGSRSARLTSAELADGLCDRSRFERALLVLAEREPDRVDLAVVREIVVALLGTRSIQETEPALDEAVRRLASLVAARLAEADAWHLGAGLDPPRSLAEGAAAWQGVERATDPSARLAGVVRDAERLRSSFALAQRYARWLERWGADAARLRSAALRLEPWARAIEAVATSQAERHARPAPSGGATAVCELVERVRRWYEQPASLVEQPLVELFELAERALSELALLADALRAAAEQAGPGSGASGHGPGADDLPAVEVPPAKLPAGPLSSVREVFPPSLARAAAVVLEEALRAVRQQIEPRLPRTRDPVEPGR